MQATELLFDNGTIRLAGTLLAAESGIPSQTALLLSGSGPLDRDSNMKRMSVEVSRQVAAHLAEDGIASFRYDKRGVGASGGDYRTAGFHDNVADARAALDALRARPEVDAEQIFVVGHSEGALIAMELAAASSGLAGAVFLAGAARSGEDLLRWQAAQVADTLPTIAKLILKVTRQDVRQSQAKRLHQLRESADDTLRVGLTRINAKWFREFMAYDPADSLPQIRIPVLAAVGAKDIQVPPGDSERICELITSECTHIVTEDLTHILRRDAGEPSLSTYKKQLKRPVEPDVLSLISAWLGERGPNTVA